MILCTLVVFALKQSITYSICELFNFRNLLLTTAVGYLLEAMTILSLLQSVDLQLKLNSD